MRIRRVATILGILIIIVLGAYFGATLINSKASQEIATRENVLSDKESTQIINEESLSAKEEELNKIEQNLSEKETSLNTLEESLQQQEISLNEYNDQLVERENSLIQQNEEVVTYDNSFFEGDVVYDESEDEYYMGEPDEDGYVPRYHITKKVDPELYVANQNDPTQAEWSFKTSDDVYNRTRKKYLETFGH